MSDRIGFGGSCHWCTEAIFQSIIGVIQVEQGWIASKEYHTLSEAVIVAFDPQIIDLHTLIEIHLRSHSATSSHCMRKKYRSAVYVFNQDQFTTSTQILKVLQTEFSEPLITQILHFDTFKLNVDNYLDYYRKNPDKPFCRNVIDPKLSKLRKMFGKAMIDNW